jgi:hypothetical protein
MEPEWSYEILSPTYPIKLYPNARYYHSMNLHCSEKLKAYINYIIIYIRTCIKILWCRDPLLGRDLETETEYSR